MAKLSRPMDTREAIKVIGLYVAPERRAAAADFDIRQTLKVDDRLDGTDWYMVTNGQVSVMEYGRLVEIMGCRPLAAVKWAHGLKPGAFLN